MGCRAVVIAIVLCLFVTSSYAAICLNQPNNLDSSNYNTYTFASYLVPSNDTELSMVIQTATNALFVVDGGGVNQASRLDKFIRVHLGYGTGTVNIAAWIVTHPHKDHVGAMLEILKPSKPYGDYAIGTVYTSEWPESYSMTFSDVAWPFSGEQGSTYDSFRSYYTSLREDWGQVRVLTSVPTPTNRVVYCTGGIIFEFFHILASGSYLTINDGSLVFKVSNNIANHATLLVTGDINYPAAKRICDIYNCSDPATKPFAATELQMSHHGQNQEGLNPLGDMHPDFVKFYKAVNPSKCLWSISASSFLEVSTNSVLKFMTCGDGNSGYKFSPPSNYNCLPAVNCANAMVPLKSNHKFSFCYDATTASHLGVWPINTDLCLNGAGGYYTNIRECLCSSANFVQKDYIPIIA